MLLGVQIDLKSSTFIKIHCSTTCLLKEMIILSHFQSRYRFKEETVKVLSTLFDNEIGPKAQTNKAFTSEQRICMALRFFATGSFQKLIGDGEGACQATIHNHVMKVARAMSNHCDDFTVFSLNEEILEQTASGFYGFFWE